MLESLLVLIPITLAVAIASAAAFLWSTDSGQFDDLDGPGERIVFDDDSVPADAMAHASDRTTAPSPTLSARL
jgi:cbb3-type cytochrome oxidase maturation protein